MTYIEPVIFRERWSISAGGRNQTCDPGSVAAEGRWEVRVELQRETHEADAWTPFSSGFSVLGGTGQAGRGP